MAQDAKIAIILNRGSGHHKGTNRASLIRRTFEALQCGVRVYPLRKGSDIAATVDKAIGNGATTVVAAGGDGTICGVAESLSNRDVALGILPLGTFNYFARSLGIPMELENAARVIASGHTSGIRLARINDRVFLNNASIGAYAAILDTREGVYRRWGRSRLAAYWSVLRTLVTFRAPLKLTVTVDGQSHRCRTAIAFAVNNAYQLDQMGIEGRERIENGELVLLIAPDTTRLGLMKHALLLALGRARKKTDYEMFCGRDIRIETRKRRRLVARDGEKERQTGPFDLTIDPRPLQVVVPANADTTARAA